jgi:hypothetical protein
VTRDTHDDVALALSSTWLGTAAALAALALANAGGRAHLPLDSRRVTCGLAIEAALVLLAALHDWMRGERGARAISLRRT